MNRWSATLVPPGSIPGAESPTGLDYDEDASEAHLAEAGWVDRDGDGRPELEDGTFPVVSLLYDQHAAYKQMALALTEQWERVLGIPIELVGRGTGFYRNDLRTGNFMIARGSWCGDYGDPTTFLDLCRSDRREQRAWIR